MKINLLILIGLLCVTFFVSSVSPSDVPVNSQLTVSEVYLNPNVFFEGDTGTVTVSVVNNGNEPVVGNRATLEDNSIRVLQSQYESVGAIGAQNRMNFTFTVKADTFGGIYYPVFHLDFRDAGQLRYPIQLVVSNTPLNVGIIQKPDNFANGRKEQIGVSVGNPRDNFVSGVTVTPECDGAEITPTSSLIGILPPNAQSVATFSITPERSSVLKIKVQYNNGINIHEQELDVPITIAEGKKQSDPILTNIQVKPESDFLHITGDVTNAGLEDAKGVVISVGPPGIPVDPYRVSVVGSLKPDDFSSFDVTFRSPNTPEVPLIVYYKDADGNIFQTNVTVEIGSMFSLVPNASSNSFPIPLFLLFVVIGLIIAGAIYRSWRIT